MQYSNILLFVFLIQWLTGPLFLKDPEFAVGAFDNHEVASKARYSILSVISDTTSVGYLMGQFSPEKHPDFEKIERKYCLRDNSYLRKEAYSAFKQMAAEARKFGIRLFILSPTRNFQDQKVIWENKWSRLLNKEKIEHTKHLSSAEKALLILKFSSMPGSSRHHWGTDIDLNSLNNSYFASGEGQKVYQWLKKNAAHYGFCQPYSSKSTGRSGYEEEKWHWSYRPLADGFTLAAKNKLKDEMLKNFLGSEAAPQIQIVALYVLGISADCFETN